MLLPLSLLQKFVDIHVPVQEVADAYYSLGFGIEQINKNILDLEITPNRGDALSVLGLAREYSAYSGNPLHIPTDLELFSEVPNVEDWKVNVSTPLVPYYFGVVMEIQNDCRSPQWVVDILDTYSINSINPIVDITNITMILFGQPLHAFDCNNLKTSTLSIRTSKKGESIEILKGNTIDLPEGSIVADDGKNIIDLVGIQGGKKSGVRNSTKKIILQAVDCNPVSIRTTSKEIGIQTEASYRFERGIDRNGAHRALSYALSLIKEICSGTVLQVIRHEQYDKRIIQLDYKNVVRVLGTRIPKHVCEELLNRLGFSINGKNVIIPSWRLSDIYFEEDLIEEIARLYGYNNLEKKSLPKFSSVVLPSDTVWTMQRSIARSLRSLGFDEVLTYSFISSKDAAQTDTNLYRKILNPMSEELSYLRNSLTPLLIQAAERNIYMPSISIFEIGTVFNKTHEVIHCALISTKPIPFIKRTISIVPNQTPYKTRKKYYAWEGSPNELVRLLPKDSHSLRLTTFPYKNPSKYQPTVFDVACIVNKKYTVEQIRTTLYESDDRILIVEPFDIYTHDVFGKNKISYAFHVLIDNIHNNFTSQSLSSIISHVYKILKDTYDAEIR